LGRMCTRGPESGATEVANAINGQPTTSGVTCLLDQPSWVGDAATSSYNRQVRWVRPFTSKRQANHAVPLSCPRAIALVWVPCTSISAMAMTAPTLMAHWSWPGAHTSLWSRLHRLVVSYCCHKFGVLGTKDHKLAHSCCTCSRVTGSPSLSPVQHDAHVRATQTLC
jgi:hypothetical protein